MDVVHLTTTVLVCTAILAVINYPIVYGVEKYIVSQEAKFVYRMDPREGQISREKRNSITTTPVHAVLFLAFIWSGCLVLGPDSIASVASTFVGTLIWTELWHYFSHRAMHLKSLHFIHLEHHRSMVTGVWTSLSFSFLEKLIFSAGILGGIALVSRWYPVSAIGITSYYVLYFYTNTLGHSNVEIRRPNYRATAIGKVLNSPTYHALHHARYVQNYGLLTPWLDQLFGTEWKDVSKVQTSAAMGHPLCTLDERL